MPAEKLTGRLAVDIGGTFTDVVAEHAGGLSSAKVPTTPGAPEQGVIAGTRLALERAGLTSRDFASVIHGTTLATNALIERTGAKTALITTDGFRDSLEIGYEARYDQYDIYLDKPAPLVPRRLRFTVPERISARGEVLTPLDEPAVSALAAVLERNGVEAVAIGFLHSYANLAHEARARELLSPRLPGVAVTLSGEVSPELREYERFSTAAANAYVQPLMGRYLEALAKVLAEEGFDCPLYLMTSAGGMTTLETAVRFPVRLVESGPSGGAMLAKTTARQCGEKAVVSYDMGGTTAKICFIDDYSPVKARNFEVARAARFIKGSGLPLRIPVIEMIEVGAGGGSIASLDALGRLTVGPRSAGADPGPACYGKGGDRATVTDADLLLGRLDPERFAHGRLELRPERAARVVDRDIGEPLGLDPARAAHGIAEIVGENMANAARVHAVEHGRDLETSTLIAFGGAGPLHAARLAEKLGIRRIIVPASPSVGSAVGFLRSPMAYEAVRSRYGTLSRFDHDAVAALYLDLYRDARAVIATSVSAENLREERIALMRYRGQGHEIEIELPPGPIGSTTGDALRRRFDRRYSELFGRTLPKVEIETLGWSLTLSGPEPAIAQVAPPVGGETPAPFARRRLFSPAAMDFVEVPAYWRPDLVPGATIAGPALIVEHLTTTVVPAAFAAGVDEFMNLVLERRDPQVQGSS